MIWVIAAAFVGLIILLALGGDSLVDVLKWVGLTLLSIITVCGCVLGSITLWTAGK